MGNKIYSIYVNQDSSGYSYTVYDIQAQKIASFYLSPGQSGLASGDNISEFEVDPAIQVNISPHQNLTQIEHEIRKLIKLAWLERGIADKHGFSSIRWKNIKRDYSKSCSLPIGITSISSTFFRNLLMNQRDASNKEESHKAFVLMCRFLYNA